MRSDTHHGDVDDSVDGDGAGAIVNHVLSGSSVKGSNVNLVLHQRAVSALTQDSAQDARSNDAPFLEQHTHTHTPTHSLVVALCECNNSMHKTGWMSHAAAQRTPATPLLRDAVKSKDTGGSQQKNLLLNSGVSAFSMMREMRTLLRPWLTSMSCTGQSACGKFETAHDTRPRHTAQLDSSCRR